MSQWVDITFDCLPLRSIGRLDIPLDASPKYQAKCLRVKKAIEKHGSHNAYYLHNATCVYHLTNQEGLGTMSFTFEGTVLTDDVDERCVSSDLQVELLGETCDWLTEPIVHWFVETVSRSVQVEFNRYIEAGDLHKAHARIEKLQETVDQSGGFLGMYL